VSITGEQNLRNDRFPISIAGAAITAFAMLYLTAEQRTLPLLPVLGAMLLLTYATKWRLPSSQWVGYALRALLFGAICYTVGIPRESATYWYFERDYTTLGGCLLAAEMVVQAWRWRDWSQPSEAAGVALLLTALIVAAASNTYKHRIVGWLVPLYAAMLIIALRQFGMTARPRRRPALIAFRAILALAALAMGYTCVESVYRFDARITHLAMKLFNRPDLRAEIGLSDTPFLGPVFNPKQSLQRVEVIDGDLSDPHLRAIAFARYENRAWRPSLRERDFQSVNREDLRPSAAGARSNVTVLSDTGGLVMTPLDTAGIDTDASIDRDDQAVLQAHDPQSDFAYTLVAPPHMAYQGPLCIAPAEAERQLLLAIPPDLDPRVVQLARRVAGSGSAIVRLTRITEELRKHHDYSLSFIPQGDPISDFVLNNRSAHCEYFASAMVLMSRAIGIPARFVTGYYAHEREAGEIVVRGRDAHAWAEAWIDGTGWITVDATPSSGTPDALYPTPSRWTRWSDAISDLPRRIRQWLSSIRRADFWKLALAPIILFTLYKLIRSQLARRSPGGLASRPYANAPPDLVAAARRFERAVRRRGMVLHPSRTWRESLSSAPQPYRDFVQLYDILRFGVGGESHRLGELLARIEQESRTSPT
jgi:transglutaminase-like putative cysteine protease